MNRCWTPCLTLLAALSLVGCGAHDRYEHHIERGKRYLADGNLGKAGIEFRNAVQIEPKDPQALYLAGRVAELRGSLREAVGLYQAAIEDQSDFENARAALGKILVLGGAANEALAVITPGLEKHPNSADLLAARAVARHQLKYDVGARADAERAVQSSPTNENAIGVLAALEAQAGDIPKAIDTVENAVRAEPASIGLRDVLINLYVRAQQPERAEQQILAIIDLRPHELKPRVALAVQYTKGHKLVEAQQVLERAVADLPQDHEAKLALVDFLATQRSRPEAEQLLRSYVGREPDNLDLRFGLGTLLERAGAVEAASAVYNEIVRRDASGAHGIEARRRLAAVALSAGKYSAASAQLREVLQKAPRDNDALFLRASVALAQDDPTSAIADLRVVARDQPRSVAVQRALANSYLATDQPGLAEDALRAAVEAAPSDATLKIDLSRVLTRTGRAEQAVKLLSDSVAQMPGELQLRMALVAAHMAARDLSGAREAVESLEKNQPANWQGYQLAGEVAVAQGRLDNAAANFAHALELQPGSATILAALSQLDHRRGNDARAIARLQAAIESGPQNFQLNDLLGRFYLQTGAAPRAREVFERLRTAEPQQWRWRAALAQVAVATQDVALATTEYEAAAKLAAREPQVMIPLASLYEQQGRIDDAIIQYEALYERPRMRQVAANNLAMLLATYKHDPVSLDRARDLTAGFAASNNGALLDTHGWVRYKRREFQDAVAVLERAADRSPDSRIIRYHLGMAELGLGRRERARSDLENALTGSASFVGAEEARSTLASLKGNS